MSAPARVRVYMSTPSSTSTRRGLLAQLIARLRTALALLFFTFFILSYSLFTLLTFRLFALSLSRPLLRFASRCSLAIVGVRVRYQAPTPYQTPAPRLIITNHLSTLDLFWFTVEVPPRLFALGKKEIRWIPILNVAWWAFRLGYIDRGARTRAIETLNDAGVATHRDARSLVLAPEGTRCRDGRLGPFKKGPFHLATEHQLPIYPVVAAGAFELMPPGQSFSWSGEIWVTPLAPVETRSLSADGLPELMETLHERIDRAYHSLRAEMGLPALEKGERTEERGESR